jgi:hypothetical protein
MATSFMIMCEVSLKAKAGNITANVRRQIPKS